MFLSCLTFILCIANVEMLSSPSMTYMKSNIDKKQIKKILINTGDQEKLNTLGIDKGGISKNQNWSVESKFHLLKSGGKQENKKIISLKKFQREESILVN